jgi:hypothetical protein
MYATIWAGHDSHWPLSTAGTGCADRGSGTQRRSACSVGARRVAGALVDLGHAVVVAAGTSSPGALARLLPGVRGVVPLPHPPPAVPPRGWAEVPPWWRRPARQLAHLLAADWPALGMTCRGDLNPQARPPKRVAAGAT